jgi:membrane-associated protein
MNVDGLSGLALYATVFTIIFVETGIPIGFWLPGDTILFAAGLLVADPAADASLPVLATGVTIAAVAGAMVGYLTGYRLGRPYLARRHGALLARTEGFYERFGSVTLIASRFVPWARTFAPLLAGAVRMPRSRFLTAAVLGAVIWGTGLTSLGYLGASLPGVRDAANWVAVVVIVVSVLAGVLGEVLRRRGNRAERPTPPPATPTPSDPTATASTAAASTAASPTASATTADSASSQS